MSRSVKTYAILHPYSPEPGPLAALGDFGTADAPDALWPRIRLGHAQRAWVAADHDFERAFAPFLAGQQGVAMVPTDTAAPWWYRAIYGKAAAITYSACDTGSGKPRQVALVAFGDREAARLIRCRIGPTVRLRHA